MGPLLAIDGTHILRRAHESNPDPDSPDKADAVLRYALALCRKMLVTHQPTHVFAAFDCGGRTWRHELHDGYREKKEPMPQTVKEGLPDFYRNLAGIGIKNISVPELDAADVIATAVLRWAGESRGDAIVASTHKELLVLLAQGAKVWDGFKSEWHDRAWVERRFGVAPEVMADLLALTGDVAEGIPGVSMIGEKKSAKLLQTYGNLDGIMAGAGILKNPLGERLRKEADALALSRKLVALKTDARLGVTWKMLEFDSRQGERA